MKDDTVMTGADLMLENGEIIEIECPLQFEDSFRQTLRDAIRRGDNWSTMRFDGCTATYMGILVTDINCKKVVGFL